MRILLIICFLVCIEPACAQDAKWQLNAMAGVSWLRKGPVWHDIYQRQPGLSGSFGIQRTFFPSGALHLCIEPRLLTQHQRVRYGRYGLGSYDAYYQKDEPEWQFYHVSERYTSLALPICLAFEVNRVDAFLGVQPSIRVFRNQRFGIKSASYGEDSAENSNVVWPGENSLRLGVLAGCSYALSDTYKLRIEYQYELSDYLHNGGNSITAVHYLNIGLGFAL